MPSERLVLRPPERGHKILIAEAGLRIPDDPIIPVIEGDGIGPEVVHAAARAIDVAIADTFGGRRKTLDLYANVRPVYWIPGMPSPVTHPERLDVVIFRE